MKNGKRITENLCMACKRDYQAESSRRFWENHKEQRMKEAREWRDRNRKAYNKSQRKWYLKAKNKKYSMEDYGVFNY
jgi:hypothetical protein